MLCAEASDDESEMTRVVQSFNGTGRLLLRGGDELAGRYHIDISYLPVRRVHETKGNFVLTVTPAWDSIVEAHFAGEAKLAMVDGREARVTLGGIVGNEVAIVAMEPPPEI